MQDEVTKLLTDLTILTLYHTEQIRTKDLLLERLLTNQPEYKPILKITKEMNAIASALEGQPQHYRLAAAIKYEDLQRQLKKELRNRKAI